ncbi:Hypothetical predicted protein [Octopus vulgaris]|uniref:Uncharacterized protein n=1 Tax=Octopus vulgaris TaxID=6645 RepID=A0AA36F781_OCTVU|nr:Hypothetical predicted protein [Octopus vulgaris]
MSKSVAVEDSCTSFMESKCPQAKKDYPIAKPDLDYCKRLIEYQKCADDIQDERCFEAFQDFFRNICPEKDDCIEYFKSYCRQAEEEFPVHSPDKDFCKRIRAYEQCAIKKKHNCDLHFHYYSLLTCGRKIFIVIYLFIASHWRIGFVTKLNSKQFNFGALPYIKSVLRDSKINIASNPFKEPIKLLAQVRFQLANSSEAVTMALS